MFLVRRGHLVFLRMIVEIGVTDDPERVGFYSGLVVSEEGRGIDRAFDETDWLACVGIGILVNGIRYEYGS